jgi:hypothetical protein
MPWLEVDVHVWLAPPTPFWQYQNLRFVLPPLPAVVEPICVYVFPLLSEIVPVPALEVKLATTNVDPLACVVTPTVVSVVFDVAARDL